MWKAKAYKVELGVANDIKNAISAAESAARSVKARAESMNKRAKSELGVVADKAKNAYKDLKREEAIIDKNVGEIENDIKEFQKAGLDSNTLKGILDDIKKAIEFNDGWMQDLWKASRL